MSIRISRAALLIAAGLIIAPVISIPDAAAQGPRSSDVVRRILQYRTELVLSGTQIGQLTQLESSLREETGRRVLVVLDRVPGKSVPRYERVPTSREEAMRQALAIIAPAHREHAQVLLAGDSARVLHQ